jgi:hypothetical protein
LLTELERMPILKDYFNTISDEIEKKYWEKGWNLPKIKNPRTEFEKVGKLRDLFLKIKIILKKNDAFWSNQYHFTTNNKKKKMHRNNIILVYRWIIPFFSYNNLQFLFFSFGMSLATCFLSPCVLHSLIYMCTTFSTKIHVLTF